MFCKIFDFYNIIIIFYFLIDEMKFKMNFDTYFYTKRIVVNQLLK